MTADDLIELAVGRANVDPIPHRLPDVFRCLPTARTIASVGWHLSKLGSDQPFFLPQTKLAKLLGIKQETVSCIIRLLVKHGMLTCVKETWGPREGGKQYTFAGTPVPAKRPDAFTTAFERATDVPYPMPRVYDELPIERKIVSVAWYLSGDKPFLLPQEKLSLLIGHEVSSSIKRLITDGYLRRHGDWSYKNGGTLYTLGPARVAAVQYSFFLGQNVIPQNIIEFVGPAAAVTMTAGGSLIVAGVEIAPLDCLVRRQDGSLEAIDSDEFMRFYAPALEAEKASVAAKITSRTELVREVLRLGSQFRKWLAAEWSPKAEGKAA
jgi:DNA-binding Lrp family transcriptional regulator